MQLCGKVLRFRNHSDSDSVTTAEQQRVIIPGAMELNGSYESKLLRILIGFLHISLSQQLSLVRHGKAFELLDPAEKTALQNEMINNVMGVARQVSEEALEAFLKPPPPAPPSGPIQ